MKTIACSLGLLLLTSGCNDDGGEDCTPATPIEVPADYAPDIDPANFVATIDNPWFPLLPGTTFVYEGTDEDEVIHDEISVTADTRVVMGVTTTVVRDTEEIDGELAEDTFDWFAQDVDGNVWYFGEESTEYENGEPVSTAGSWEAGVDGALPGIVMRADPQVGDTYRQEHFAGEAEDRGEVVSLDETVDGPLDTWENVLVTREWSPLEPCVDENKYYADGVGMVRAAGRTGSEEILDLVEVQTD